MISNDEKHNRHIIHLHTHMIIIFITFIDMMCEPNMLSFSKLKRLGSIFQVTWPAEKFARKEPGLAGKPGK